MWIGTGGKQCTVPLNDSRKGSGSRMQYLVGIRPIHGCIRSALNAILMDPINRFAPFYHVNMGIQAKG